MSTVAKKVLMGSGAGDSAYEIDQSILLNSADIPNISRQAAATGNRRTFTYSCWVKLSKAAVKTIIAFGNAADTSWASLSTFTDNSGHHFGFTIGQSSVQARLVATAECRDFSAWYHIVVAVDTTQGTAANRIKMYVNGTQITSFSTGTYPSQNYDTAFSLDDHYLTIGQNAYNFTSSYNGGIDGYIAEVHVIDGVAKAPSDFGETNEDTGQWIPKEYTGGSYGTNGFYGKFVSGAIGTDSSGTGNTMTVANLANSDVVTDSPTNNFATLNPIFISGDTNTFSEGNLKVVMATAAGGLTVATIVPTAGKYYAEFKMTAGDPSYGYMGVTPVTTNSKAPAYMTAANNSYAYYGYNGQIIKYPNDTVLSTEASYGVNDVVGIAIDYDNSTIKWYKNNALQYTKTSAVLTDVTFGLSDTSSGAGQTVEVNFGQKAFAYTPPSGYTTLSTANLPDPAITLPSVQFNTALYEGTGATQTVTGVGFQPDWVWVKNRSAVASHMVVDAVRGVGAGGTNTHPSFPNTTDAEEDQGSGTNKISALNSDGFVIDGNSGILNTDDQNYVAWNWKANGSGSTDTSGDIDGVVSANQAAGFSIITFTSDGSTAGTIPHGLGGKPDLMIYFHRNAVGAHPTYFFGSDGALDKCVLNRTDASSDVSSGSTASGTLPSTSMIQTQGYGNGAELVVYAFRSIESYSKVGFYTGNGSADGPMVNTGFKPAWLMIKNTSNAQDWIIWDTKRNPSNEVTLFLYPNLTDGDATGSNVVDLVSNGFKLRNAGTRNRNYNGDVYLFMAFAEAPFKYATAR